MFVWRVPTLTTKNVLGISALILANVEFGQTGVTEDSLTRMVKQGHKQSGGYEYDWLLASVGKQSRWRAWMFEIFIGLIS